MIGEALRSRQANQLSLPQERKCLAAA